MSTEFGIFGDEGCCEREFYSRSEADAALAANYSSDDDLHVSECCSEHPDNERDGCEDCAAEDVEPVACSMCGGECAPLGCLGMRAHYRCRNCGMDQSREVVEP